MYSIYEKYGRVMLIVVCSLLMLTMVVIPSSNNISAFFGGNSPVSGVKVNGKKFSQDLYERAQTDLSYLQNIGHVQVGMQGTKQYESMLELLLGNAGLPRGAVSSEKLEALTRQPLMYALLCSEAERSGSAFDPRDVEQLLKPPFGIRAGQGEVDQLTSTDPRYETAKAAIERALMVRGHMMREVFALKPVSSQINNYLAGAFQEINVRMIEFNASEFLPQTAAPSQDQLQKQFDSYAALSPVNIAVADTTEANQHGYGYRIPDRIRLQYLAVSMDDVRKTIDASKSQDDWDIEAATFYARNKEKYLIAPSTQPTTVPTSGPSYKPFELVKDEILKNVKAPLIDEQQKKITTRIITLLQGDFQKARTAAPTTQAVGEAVSSSSSSKIGDEAYLKNIAAAIEKQFGLLPKVVAINSFQSHDDLTKIGLSTAVQFGGRGRVSTLPTYIFSALRDIQPTLRPGADVLDLFQPTPVFESDSEAIVARVVAVDPSHPPENLDKVREDVTKDVLNNLANQKAEEYARSLVDSARRNNLDGVAGTRKIIASTKPFGLPDLSNPYLPPEPLPGYGSDDILLNVELMRACFDLQRKVQSPAELPYTDVVVLPKYNKVFLVELTSIQTRLNTRIAPEAARQLTMRGRQPDLQTCATLLGEWLDPVNIINRNQVVMTNPPERAKKEEAPIAPRNPLMP